MAVFELLLYALTNPDKNGLPIANGIIFSAKSSGRGVAFSLWADRQPVNIGSPIATKNIAIFGFPRITLILIRSKLDAK